MRERIFILLSVVIIVFALVGLNAASYVQTKQEPDTEERARRTTFNAGATGTKAFFDFLRESGKHAVRWQQKPADLLEKNRNQPTTLFIIGRTLRPFEDQDLRNILNWTRQGGRLVVVDRNPNARLLPETNGWKVSVLSKPSFLSGEAASDNVNEMTNGVTAAKPAQPSVLTSAVNSVMSSRFAASIKIEPTEKKVAFAEKTPESKNDSIPQDEPPPPPKPAPTGNGIGSNRADATSVQGEKANNDFPVPISLLTATDQTILIDYPYGAGRIIYLSDPYVLSNAGIALADNLQLAANLAGDGVIAFDEYHQGYGASGNAVYNYFENTPIPAIFGQFALLVLLLIYTKGRRFARAVPLPVADRRSKLEYVAAMAQLQQRAKTYDLAIENIYARVRRELARFAGVDGTKPREELAARVADRSKLNRTELETVMRECEEAINGAPLDAKKALRLAARLREIEAELSPSKNARILK